MKVKDEEVNFVDSILMPEKCPSIENVFERGEYIVLIQTYNSFSYSIDKFIHVYSEY